MRSILLLAVFTAAVPLLVYGQTDPGAQTKPTPSAGQQSGAVEQTLIRLDRELMDAAVRKDKTVFERTALDRYVFVNQKGQWRLAAMSVVPIPRPQRTPAATPSPTP